MRTTVAEIRAMMRNASADEFKAIERSLADDERKGVQAALEEARRRLAAQEAERARVQSLMEFDRSCLSGEHGVVVGLDEVGRGAVAGPLAVGAVALPEGAFIAELNDSKRLTPERREEVADRIRQTALAWTVAYVEPASIDRNGMAASLKHAFKEALSGIEGKGLTAEVVLVDGNPLHIDEREINVVKGDAKSASIAAASVIAKVERDALMRELSARFPPYGFSTNKGYASEDHIEAIRAHGLTEVHRASFCRSFMQETLF